MGHVSNVPVFRTDPITIHAGGPKRPLAAHSVIADDATTLQPPLRDMVDAMRQVQTWWAWHGVSPIRGLALPPNTMCRTQITCRNARDGLKIPTTI